MFPLNNFIQEEYTDGQGFVSQLSDLSASAFIESSANINSKLKARIPNSRVAFGTISSVHFEQLQKSRLKSKLLKVVRYPKGALAIFQD